MDSEFLFNTFVFLAASCIVVPLAARFKLGAVLGYLAAGILIGPFGLGLIGNAGRIMHFAEFGVVMMLFIIGLELEPIVLWRRRNAILGLGGLQVVLTTGLLALAGMAAGYGLAASLAAAAALALSSTALVLQMLEERNLVHTQVGEQAFSLLLFQDIAVIPILVLMPLLAADGVEAPGHQHAAMLDSLPGWAHALLVATVIAAVVVGGRRYSRLVFRTIAKTHLREVFTATSLGLLVGIALLMQQLGVSPALGAFIAGLVLANSEYRRTLETDIEPFKGLLLGLFFISIGMGMDFDLFMEAPLRILLMVLGLMAVKALVLFPLGYAFGLTARYRLGFALALSQGGEFAFVLFQFARGLDILSHDQAAMLTLVVALSIAATPLLMLAYSRFIVPRFMSMLPLATYDAIDEHHAVIIAGFGRVGQVVGRFLNSQGVKTTVLEKDPDQVELLRKFGFKGYFGDASRLDLLRAAGAADAKLLVIAVDDADVSLEIASLAKEAFPNLKLYARARNRQHAYALHKAGVDYFKRETFDASLAMAKDIMVALGRKESDMAFKTEQFRLHDETTLRKSFDFFENEAEMVSFSRLQREELERILREDVQEHAT